MCDCLLRWEEGHGIIAADDDDDDASPSSSNASDWNVESITSLVHEYRRTGNYQPPPTFAAMSFGRVAKNPWATTAAEGEGGEDQEDQDKENQDNDEDDEEDASRREGFFAEVAENQRHASAEAARLDAKLAKHPERRHVCANAAACPLRNEPVARCGRVDLKACSGCKEAFYCDRHCQAAHWKEHKKTCKGRIRCSGKKAK